MEVTRDDSMDDTMEVNIQVGIHESIQDNIYVGNHLSVNATEENEERLAFGGGACFVK